MLINARMTQNQEENTSLRSKEMQNNELECIEGGAMIKLNTILPLIHCFALR
jgi:bacteriocin-like protein